MEDSGLGDPWEIFRLYVIMSVVFIVAFRVINWISNENTKA